MKRLTRFALACVVVAATSSIGLAQAHPDPKALMAAQKDAMRALAGMDGVWRGPAWTILPSGEKQEITQTERIGPFLDGSVKVIEGRGYDSNGDVAFNALGIVSFDPAKKTYTMHTHAMGRAGDFTLTPAPGGGYVWEVPAGPMTIRYTATIADGKWREVGDRIMPGKEPVRFFEMNLVRVGDTDWPAGEAVPMK